MYALFPSRKRANAKKTESKLYSMVDRKEKQEQVIDEHGRALVMTLREYLANPKSTKYATIMRKIKRYMDENQHY